MRQAPDLPELGDAPEPAPAPAVEAEIPAAPELRDREPRRVAMTGAAAAQAKN